MATIKLRDAIERRDGETMGIGVNGVYELYMIRDYKFTEEELDSEMTISDGSFFTGLSKAKFTDVTATVNGKEINFSII
jgi:hypothetical protein